MSEIDDYKWEAEQNGDNPFTRSGVVRQYLISEYKKVGEEPVYFNYKGLDYVFPYSYINSKSDNKTGDFWKDIVEYNNPETQKEIKKFVNDDKDSVLADVILVNSIKLAITKDMDIDENDNRKAVKQAIAYYFEKNYTSKYHMAALEHLGVIKDGLPPEYRNYIKEAAEAINPALEKVKDTIGSFARKTAQKLQKAATDKNNKKVIADKIKKIADEANKLQSYASERLKNADVSSKEGVDALIKVVGKFNAVGNQLGDAGGKATEVIKEELNGALQNLGEFVEEKIDRVKLPVKKVLLASLAIVVGTGVAKYSQEKGNKQSFHDIASKNIRDIKPNDVLNLTKMFIDDTNSAVKTAQEVVITKMSDRKKQIQSQRINGALEGAAGILFGENDEKAKALKSVGSVEEKKKGLSDSSVIFPNPVKPYRTPAQDMTRNTAYDAAAKVLGNDFDLITTATGIVSMESSFVPENKSPKSSATGLYQHLDNTWMWQISTKPEIYAPHVGFTVEQIKKIKPVEGKDGKIIFTTGSAWLDKRMLDKRKNPEIAGFVGAQLLLMHKKDYEDNFGKLAPERYAELYAIHHHGLSNYKFFKENAKKDVTKSKEYKKIIKSNGWIAKYKFKETGKNGKVVERKVKTGQDMIDVAIAIVKPHIERERKEHAYELLVNEHEKLMEAMNTTVAPKDTDSKKMLSKHVQSQREHG